ncbi:phage terminase large subunit [Alicyclobacillus fastidiosus]|uniref:Phage terminase large subunit n=1 Tax=Alicyclobacillus fastidiosus TaxID=392011 RepID=A0ABY6ZN22_9BACL|nr:phage terminase large subunit [Alicyclobacillus fastidiosus]WAH43499.1 phage terminase large subunit [Alicyclobacillus fastidiosus]GMA59659.1 hypothetical protein GCM10025859_00990 [Alicyclobacillus fastidiosus]
MFHGADDPAKIKSIKTSKFPIARLWVEELAECQTEDEVSTIVNSVVRAERPHSAFRIPADDGRKLRRVPARRVLLSTPPRQTDSAQVITRQINGYDLT